MDEKRIQVMELFGPTIQGEGIMTGTITHFLRVGGCSLRCSWCDSMFAVDPSQILKHRTLMSVQQIIAAIQEMPYAPYMTFTGGDPAIVERLGELIPVLNANGIRVAVETQGMFFPKWFDNADVLTFSPKGPSSGNVVDIDPLSTWLMEKGIRKTFHTCIKIVVFNEADFEYAMHVYNTLPEWTYDAFYFTAGTPPYQEGAFDPKTMDELDFETNKLNRQIDVLHNQQTLADLLLEQAKGGKTQFNSKVHLGCQQHVLLWPESDKGI